MAKILPASIRDVVKYPSTATVSALDPTLYDSPTVFRYSAWDLFGSKRNPGKGKYGPFGIAGPGGDISKLFVMLAEKKIEKYSFARPSINWEEGMPGAYADVMNSQFLPGMFSYFRVPFHVTEAKVNFDQTGKMVYHREYVPSYSMRVLTELAIVRAGQSFLGAQFGLDGYSTVAGASHALFDGRKLTWDLDPALGGAAIGNKSMKDAIAYLSSPERGGGDWRFPNFDSWLLKGPLVTQEEWLNEGGAYSYFGRGGFLVDYKLATGVHGLDYYDRSYDLAKRGFSGNSGRRFQSAIWPCAVWARDTKYKEFNVGQMSHVGGFEQIKTPAGRPYCLVAAAVPGTTNLGNEPGWEPYVDVLTRGRLYQLRLHLRPYDEGFAPLVALSEFMSGTVRALCDAGPTIQKVMTAASAFAALQGKTAQDAKAKAKTAADVANAAELAATYKNLAWEIQLAAAAGSLFCNFVPETPVPPIDLPDVEPPPSNPKFDVQEMMDSIRYTGPLSLSPDKITQGRGWTTAAMAIVAAAGAVAGAVAYQRKNK